MNKPRLVLAGLCDDKNLGDPIIAYSTEWLISNNLPQKGNIVQLLLFPKQPFIYRLRSYIKRKLGLSTREIELKQSLSSYYKRHIQSRDFIILVGGGLIKYKHQNLHIALSELLKIAEQKKAKVVFNSLGVEGYDENSPQCQMLKQAIQQAIQSKTLVYFTTRDDIDTLKTKYLDNVPLIPCMRVADPAVWCADAYNIAPKKNNDTIGIGIIRDNIFSDYNIPYTADQLTQLYIDIIKELIRQNEKICLFTNGLEYDNVFALQIQRMLQEQNIHCNLQIPQTPDELITIISEYKGIISARLHSCIIAYSLGIPAVGLVWNDKLKLFGKNIEAEDYFISHDKFSAEYIIQQFRKALAHGYPEATKEQFRQTIKDSIKDIVKLYTSN